MRLVIYLVLMAGTTYLIRVIPFTLFQEKIESRLIRSFLYYVPYAVLSAMTFPAIFYSTGDMRTAWAGTIVALILAYRRCSLIVVAMSAAVTVYVCSLFI